MKREKGSNKREEEGREKREEKGNMEGHNNKYFIWTNLRIG